MSTTETPTCASTSYQIRSGYTAVNELMNLCLFAERQRVRQRGRKKEEREKGREREREGDVRVKRKR